MPDYPIKHTRDNPVGYRSPLDRQMKYQEVTLKVDGPSSAQVAEEPIEGDKQRQPVAYIPGVDTCIRGWYIYKDPSEAQIKQQNRRLMIFFHENAGNIGLRLDYFELAYKRLNCDIFVIAYRGYSDSDGVPDEALIKKDMIHLNNYITSQFKHKYYHAGGIFIVGRSLGGAVGTYLASINELGAKENYYDHNFNGIVLENTFTSIDDMVDVIFPFLKYLKWIVLNMHWNTNALIKDIRSPLLIVVGEKDEIVPSDHGTRLYDSAVNTVLKDTLYVKDGHHNDTW